MAGIVGSKLARASGGTVSTVGVYTVHAFTTTGANTFTPATTGFVDILLVGGGAASGTLISGGSSNIIGGGGAGATLFKKMIPVTASTPYPINVGTAGTNTTFTYSGITTTAATGGIGGPNTSLIINGSETHGRPAPSASGGGSANSSPPGGGGAGAGVLGIGFPGGPGTTPAPHFPGGGGGGAGGAGAGFPGGAGGPGVPITYFTGVSPDIVSVGGPAGGITSTSYGSGGGTSGLSPGTFAPGRQGVAYIRYI